MSKRPQPSPEPPTITSQRAIELLREQLVKLEDITKLHRRDPEVQKWKSTTEGVINAAFGKPNGELHAVARSFIYTDGPMQTGRQDAYYESLHRESMIRKKAALDSAVEQLQILAPPIAQVSAGTYRFHPEVERVSGDLFRDGHYKQAAFEAYIWVIEEVKRRSGLTVEGDNLMNQAFGCDGGRVPVLKFNALSNDAERDEQRGFMFFFKGIVGLRNSKAHSNRLFNDPIRAHDYLSLASLLARVLEQLAKE